MKLKKLIALGLIVSSVMVVSQSAFSYKKCPEKCIPNQGCQVDIYNCK